MLALREDNPYLPLERLDQYEVARRHQLLVRAPLLTTLLDGIPDGAMILTPQRQIAVANRALREHLQKNEQELLGLRPGEAFGCIHVHTEQHDCGSTSFCRHCGAAKTIFQCRMGQQGAEECRIEASKGAKSQSYDLLVWGTPFDLEGEEFIFLAVADISHEKRRQALERIFLHDFRNTAGGVLGLARLLQEEVDPNQQEIVSVMVQGMEMMLGGIEAQRQLLWAENGELEVDLCQVDAWRALQEVGKAFGPSPEGQGKQLVVDPESQGLTLRTDPTLLHRVLANLVKNALEACQPGDTVRLGCRPEDGNLCLWINNPGQMPEKVRRQMFKRSFSTKGLGRGLGAYSAKLITERYLDGQIGFSSTPQEGTTFSVRLPHEMQKTI